jgi:hypothetical protein
MVKNQPNCQLKIIFLTRLVCLVCWELILMREWREMASRVFLWARARADLWAARAEEEFWWRVWEVMVRFMDL